MAKLTIVKLDQAALAAAMRALFEKSMEWVRSPPNRDLASLGGDLKRLWAAGLPGECPISKDIYVKKIGGNDIEGGLVHHLLLQGKDGNDVPARVCIQANERWALMNLEIEPAIKVKVPVLTHRLESISIDLSDDMVVYEFESDRPTPREIEDRDWDYYFDAIDEDDEADDLDDKIEKARAELERLERLKAQPDATPSTPLPEDH